MVVHTCTARLCLITRDAQANGQVQVALMRERLSDVAKRADGCYSMMQAAHAQLVALTRALPPSHAHAANTSASLLQEIAYETESIIELCGSPEGVMPEGVPPSDQMTTITW